ncbi:MAG: D-erythronate dehydrogenase [Planctomycetaceae bacterium]
MEILVTGGAGFLGRKLVGALLRRGEWPDARGEEQRITRLILLDQVATPCPDSRCVSLVGDLSDPQVVAEALTPGVRVIFHLGAVVSGEAERDFDLGMRVNFDATRLLLERARRNGNVPRVVFTSSVAVFGGELPATVTDETPAHPHNSYGVQKVLGELLVADYTRRGFLDGRSVRLPIVAIRPGRPNRAASGFASGIIREPLAGERGVCPVPSTTRLWIGSPRGAIANLVQAGWLDQASWGSPFAVNATGLSVTTGEMVAALERVAGREVAGRVDWQPDPEVQRIVGGWPGRLETARACRLGMHRETTFDDVIRAYLEEDLQKT